MTVCWSKYWICNSCDYNNLSLKRISMIGDERFSQHWILKLWSPGIQHPAVWQTCVFEMLVQTNRTSEHVISQMATTLLSSWLLVLCLWNKIEAYEWKKFRKKLKINKFNFTLWMFKLNISVTACTILLECSIDTSDSISRHNMYNYK
jgi:hypothetical protein